MTDIRELTKGIAGCACGRAHTCPIDIVEIASGVIERLDALCESFSRILLVADQNTWRVCGEHAAAVLGRRIADKIVFDTGDGVLVPDEAAIARINEHITADIDLILGVGSGVINDLCKHTSFEHDLPYYIIATATSMDGYASVGSALILGGMKITLNARPPKAIIADPAVLKDAPMEMLQAGYGDIIGKYSCLNDWKLAACVRDEYFCQTVYDLTASQVERVRALADGIAARDEAAVAALMEALVVVGIAMAYVGNSRPASGSEHHFSHYFEITGILRNEPYLAHGIDVLYSAVATARLREEILAGKPLRRAFDASDWEREIARVYGTSADGVIALQKKLGWYEQDDAGVVTEKWDEICRILREAPGEDEMLALTRRIGLDYAAFEKLYGAEKIADARLYAKDLKDRYTVLWLYYVYFR